MTDMDATLGSGAADLRKRTRYTSAVQRVLNALHGLAPPRLVQFDYKYRPTLLITPRLCGGQNNETVLSTK